MDTNPNVDNSTRFSVVSDIDQSGLLWITASLCLIYFLMMCALRIYITWRNVKKDSIMLLIASAFGIAQVMAVFDSLVCGFGKTSALLSEVQLKKAQKTYYVSQILLFITTSFTKCSLALFILRLTPFEEHVWLCWGVFILCAIWGLFSVSILATRCDSSEPWIVVGGKCTNMFQGWQAISALNIITELMLILLPIIIIWKIRMPLAKKFLVVLGFLFRIPLIALTSVHLVLLHTSLRTSDYTLSSSKPALLLEVNMAWSIISATIPCVKSFIENLGTGYMGAQLRRTIRTEAGYGTENEETPGTEAYVLMTIGGTSARNRSKVSAASERSLTRRSEEGEDTIRKTMGYNVMYDV